MLEPAFDVPIGVLNKLVKSYSLSSGVIGFCEIGGTEQKISSMVGVDVRVPGGMSMVRSVSNVEARGRGLGQMCPRMTMVVLRDGKGVSMI